MSLLAVLPPSSVATVIVTLPAPLPVTVAVRPSVLGSTVAILSSLLFHVAFLLLAFSGRTVTVSCVVPPMAITAAG